MLRLKKMKLQVALFEKYILLVSICKIAID